MESTHTGEGGRYRQPDIAWFPLNLYVTAEKEEARKMGRQGKGLPSLVLDSHCSIWSKKEYSQFRVKLYKKRRVENMRGRGEKGNQLTGTRL